jgi:hypothetical protein
MFTTCFYYISPSKLELLIQEPQKFLYPEQIRLNRADEYFGEGTIARFPQIEKDLREAIKCYAFDCLAACAFHLMRATEAGKLRVLALCEIVDPVASWGTALDRAEKLTQKTEYKNRPESLKIQANFDLVVAITADMRSLQRLRNRLSHLDDKLGGAVVDAQDVYDLMITTRSFLRHLAQ